MKSRIIGLLALAVLAGSRSADADTLLYTFWFDAMEPQYYGYEAATISLIATEPILAAPRILYYERRNHSGTGDVNGCAPGYLQYSGRYDAFITYGVFDGIGTCGDGSEGPQVDGLVFAPDNGLPSMTGVFQSSNGAGRLVMEDDDFSYIYLTRGKLTISYIPEPGTLALLGLGLGLAALGLNRRRKA